MRVKAMRLMDVNFFNKETIKESVLNIKLTNRPVIGYNNG